MKVICLSAGHTPGKDPGAVKSPLVEADLNVKIVKQAAEMLRKHGIGVLEVPDDLTLKETIKWINARSGQIDLAVEVHINAGNGTGVEAWHYKGSVASKEVGQFIVDALAIETGMGNRGVKSEATNRHGKLGFVHDTTPLAILVECGFIDNKTDRKILMKDEGLRNLAKGVARGCLGYLREDWKPELLGDKPQAETSPIVPGAIPDVEVGVDVPEKPVKLKPVPKASTPKVESVKEFARILVISIIPVLIDLLPKIDLTPEMYLIAIAVLKAVDKYLYKNGKELKDASKIKGLVRF